MDGRPKEIFTKSRVNWGHASGQQLERALADSGGENMHLVNSVEVLMQCDTRRGFD